MKTDAERIEENRFDMETIWNRCTEKEIPFPPSKTEYIRYISTDPKYLYMVGFVDVDTFSYEEWEKAFEDCRQADGTYLISREKFISLGKYKYSGPVKKPLDALQIREGWYELADWREFCRKAIIPSSSIFTVDHIAQMEKIGREKGTIVNGRILIDKSDKLRIQQALEEYPSPVRRREVAVAKAYQELMKSESDRSKKSVIKTTFKVGKKLGDQQKKQLKETLLKSAQIVASSTQEEPPTLSLKDLRKKSKNKPSV